MAKVHFFAVLEVEHDGAATPEELANAVGAALDHVDIDITIMGPHVGISHAKVIGCIGLDYLKPEDVQELINGAR